ncbi:hypothetical protein KUTeg_024043 [Tegillarca granosa]|uniref:Uncharacterized protein n=1 Tax=Tegillarca granosa TaxID=220873 RepID=A0ABQ9E0S7_TEGGR|nr:hypothetical protein KUTeg_024043 [Tegillarca granosa]
MIALSTNVSDLNFACPGDTINRIMATGHILPGYGQPVTRLTRAKSAFPLDKTKLKEFAELNVPKPAREDLDRIRENARYMWSRMDRAPTTYNFQFREKQGQYMRSRPASPTRRNKPHPPLVFLTNRLHYIPGYHNADTTVGKDVYRVITYHVFDNIVFQTFELVDILLMPNSIDKINVIYIYFVIKVDGVVPYEEQLYRQQMREKYIGRVTSAVNPYRDSYATAPQRQCEETENAPRPLTAMPSLHRWMKMSGKRENSALQHHLRGIHLNPNNMSYDQLVLAYNQISGTTDDRRQTDINNIKRTRIVHKPLRGDFSMHPEWPPSIPHHSIP